MRCRDEHCVHAVAQGGDPIPQSVVGAERGDYPNHEKEGTGVAFTLLCGGVLRAGRSHRL